MNKVTVLLMSFQKFEVDTLTEVSYVTLEDLYESRTFINENLLLKLKRLLFSISVFRDH